MTDFKLWSGQCSNFLNKSSQNERLQPFRVSDKAARLSYKRFASDKPSESFARFSIGAQFIQILRPADVDRSRVDRTRMVQSGSGAGRSGSDLLFDSLEGIFLCLFPRPSEERLRVTRCIHKRRFGVFYSKRQAYPLRLA